MDQNNKPYVWPQQDIITGILSMNAGIRAGEVCIQGTRIPAGAYWPWELFDRSDSLKDAGLTREQVLAARAFSLGVNWQRSRSRRKQWDRTVHEEWETFDNERYPSNTEQ